MIWGSIWLFSQFVAYFTNVNSVQVDKQVVKFTQNDTRPYEKDFRKFVTNYNKGYEVGSIEYYHRMKVFADNLGRVSELNRGRSGKDSAVYGVTKFSDLTESEFREIYLRPLVYNDSLASVEVKPLLFLSPNGPPKKLNIPDKVDWRQKNVVTPVQNQKTCGSCWAFAVTETIESTYALSTNGSLVDLSEQEMMDCSEGYKNSLNGCNGGDTCTALEWMVTTKTGLVTESAYPVTDKDEACRIQPSSAKGVHVSHYTCQDFHSNEHRLLELLTTGPVSAAVDATTWNNYLGGVIQFHCGSADVNHAVEIVGYDKTAEVPHYIAKNSWGTDWGNQGYVYIRIGGDVCKIASRVSKVWTYYGN